MRFLVVFFALALVSASHGSKMSKNQHQHQHHDSKSIGKGLAEDGKAFIECFEEKMASGIPELGILPMEPLEIPEQTVDLVILNLDYVTGSVTNRNLRVDGFTTWKVNDLAINSTSNPDGFDIDYDLINPEINVDTDYEMDVSINGTRVFGAGHLTVKLVKETNKGNMKITAEKPVQMNDFNIYYGLESVNFKITGLMNDEEYSALISEYISANLPNIMVKNKDQINEVNKHIVITNFNLLSPALGPLFEEILKLCQ